MKRGWITWDHAELPPAVFQERLCRVRKFLSERDLPAMVVYSDVSRSNSGRHLTNFMPYWNRALLVVPVQNPPILICALSPRVYPWIRSVTTLEDIRPGANLLKQLQQVSSEHHWQKIGILDLLQLPQDLFASLTKTGMETIDIPSHLITGFNSDDWELSMRRRAANLARQVLAEELPQGTGRRDFDFVGRLEEKLRRAGAEDLLILLSHGDSAPLPAKGIILGDSYSVTLAMEYRGHWIRLSRPQTSAAVAESLLKSFHRLLNDPNAATNVSVYVDNLSGPYPFESVDRSEVQRGSIFAFHVESLENPQRFFYGDTCWIGETGAEPL
jgi:hypothetical protein